MQCASRAFVKSIQEFRITDYRRIYLGCLNNLAQTVMKFTSLTFVVVLIWANRNVSGATNGPSESRNKNDVKKTRDKIILGEDIQSTNHEHT